MLEQIEHHQGSARGVENLLALALAAAHRLVPAYHKVTVTVFSRV
jgi:hypothetical protein